MPIYEYKCQDCGTKFEALRSIRDADTLIECKHCHSDKTVRVLSTCNSRMEGGSTRSNSSSCAGCSGGSCGNCGH